MRPSLDGPLLRNADLQSRVHIQTWRQVASPSHDIPGLAAAFPVCEAIGKCVGFAPRPSAEVVPEPLVRLCDTVDTLRALRTRCPAFAQP